MCFFKHFGKVGNSCGFRVGRKKVPSLGSYRKGLSSTSHQEGGGGPPCPNGCARRSHLNIELPSTTGLTTVLAKGSVCANKVNRSLQQHQNELAELSPVGSITFQKGHLLILSRLMLSNDSSTIQTGDAAAGRPSSSRIKKGCRVWPKLQEELHLQAKLVSGFRTIYKLLSSLCYNTRFFIKYRLLSSGDALLKFCLIVHNVDPVVLD